MYHEDTLYELSSDEQVRLDYERRQKAWRDRHSQNEGYYFDGVQKGYEVVLELINKGYSPEEIKQHIEKN